MQVQVCWHCGSMLQAGVTLCPVCGAQAIAQQPAYDQWSPQPQQFTAGFVSNLTAEQRAYLEQWALPANLTPEQISYVEYYGPEAYAAQYGQQLFIDEYGHAFVLPDQREVEVAVAAGPTPEQLYWQQQFAYAQQQQQVQQQHEQQQREQQQQQREQQQREQQLYEAAQAAYAASPVMEGVHSHSPVDGHPPAGVKPPRRKAPEKSRLAPSARASERLASMYALGDAFVGAPASMGTRLLSLFIDLVAIALAGVGAWVLSDAPFLGALVAVEVAVIFTVAQARTGASLGKLVTRTRVSQADKPHSPGLWRAAFRAAIMGAGALIAAVGAFAIEVTALSDSTGKRRTIADRAAKTVVVSLPSAPTRRAADEEAVEAAHESYLVALSPTVDRAHDVLGGTSDIADTHGSAVLGQAAPDVSPAVASEIAVAARFATPAAPGSARVASLSAESGMTESPTTPQFPPPPAHVPASVAAVPAATPVGQNERPLARRSSYQDRNRAILLTFDTGQQEQVDAYGTAILGRAPGAGYGAAARIVVADPSTTISKNHVRWEHDETGLWVTDLGSTNGTELEYDDRTTVALAAGERTTLDRVVRVRIGDRSFTMSPVSGGAA